MLEDSVLYSVFKFNFKFTVLTVKDLSKMKPVEVDVDSIIYGFSSLAAYKPTTPIEINVTGNCVPCRNTKLLNGIFGVSRKSKYKRLIKVRSGLLICFIFIAFSHVEFTLGGDPPIRVLVSVPTGFCSSELSSDNSEDEVDVEEVVGYDYRKYFLDQFLGRAIMKLGSDSRSRRKGAGNPTNSKWHLHPADWPQVVFEVERLTTEANTFGCFL